MCDSQIQVSEKKGTFIMAVPCFLQVTKVCSIHVDIIGECNDGIVCKILFPKGIKVSGISFLKLPS